jgi:hypothetical protein
MIFYTYELMDSSNNVSSQRPFAEIIIGGDYTVVVMTNLGCRSFPQTITIQESDVAALVPEDVITIDNSRNNVLEVITSNQNLGIGDYEISLNDSFGPYQDSPVFSYVIPGEQTLFVKGKNDCGLIQLEV